jgi:hypothetical protein
MDVLPENIQLDVEVAVSSLLPVKSKHIPGDSDWYSRPYIFFVLRKKYSKPYIFKSLVKLQ